MKIKLFAAFFLFFVSLIIFTTDNTIARTWEGSDFYKHYAEETIVEWLEKDYLKADKDVNIGVNNNLTKAEFAVLLDRLFEYSYKKPSEIKKYRDLTTSSWAYPSIIKLTYTGVITASANGDISPNKTLTKEELAVMLVRFFHLKGETNLDYKDKEQISKWAIGSFAALKANNIKFPLSEINELKPKNTVSKGDIIFILDQFLKSSHLLGDIKIKQKELPFQLHLEGYGNLNLNYYNYHYEDYLAIIPKEYKGKEIKLELTFNPDYDIDSNYNNPNKFKYTDYDLVEDTRTYKRPEIFRIIYSDNPSNDKPSVYNNKLLIDSENKATITTIANTPKHINLDNEYINIILEYSKDDIKLYKSDNYLYTNANNYVGADTIIVTVDNKYTKNGVGMDERISSSYFSNYNVLTSNLENMSKRYIKLVPFDNLTDIGEVHIRVIKKGVIVIDEVVPYDFTPYKTKDLLSSEVIINYTNKEKIDLINKDENREFLYYSYEIDVLDYIKNNYPNAVWYDDYVNDIKIYNPVLTKSDTKWYASYSAKFFNSVSDYIYYERRFSNTNSIDANNEHIILLYDRNFNFIEALKLVVDVPSEYIKDGVQKMAASQRSQYVSQKPILADLKVNGSNIFDNSAIGYFPSDDPNNQYEKHEKFNSNNTYYTKYINFSAEDTNVITIEWEVPSGLKVKTEEDLYYIKDRNYEKVELSDNSIEIKIEDNKLFNLNLIVTNEFNNESQRYRITFDPLVKLNESIKNIWPEMIALQRDHSELQIGDEIEITIPSTLTTNNKQYTKSIKVEKNIYDYYYLTDKKPIIKKGGTGLITYKFKRKGSIIYEGEYYYDNRLVPVLTNKNYSFKVSPLKTEDVINYKMDIEWSTALFAGHADLSAIPKAKYGVFVDIYKPTDTMHVLSEAETFESYEKNRLKYYYRDIDLHPIDKVPYDSNHIAIITNEYHILDKIPLYFIVLDENKKLIAIAEVQLNVTTDTVHYIVKKLVKSNY